MLYSVLIVALVVIYALITQFMIIRLAGGKEIKVELPKPIVKSKKLSKEELKTLKEEELEARKRRERILATMRNVERYDGTSNGQIEVK